MLGKVIFLLVAIVPPNVSGMNCNNVPTSEGLVTLTNGAYACAALGPGETYDADAGKRYVICNNGQYIVEGCYNNLRFDVQAGWCDYVSNCALPGVSTTTTTTTPPPTTTSSTTAAPTTTTTPSTTAPPPTTTTAPPPPPSSTETTEEPNTTTGTTMAPPPTTTPTTTTPPSTTTAPPPTTTAPPPTTTAPPPTTTTPPPTTTTTTTTTAAPSPPVAFLSYCSQNVNCFLPDCFCHGAVPDMAVEDMPQFIMLTFDDAVTAQFYGSYYKALFVDQSVISQPNGCPVKGTMYLSHANTDYYSVKKLVEAGNEIASHTINHILPENEEYQATMDEIEGLRDLFESITGFPKEIIKGFRSPYLKISHNIQFKVLRDCNFIYDSTITNRLTTLNKKPIWPYTLDAKPIECSNGNCPTQAFPGFWEVPINNWLGTLNSSYCSLIDGCIVGDNLFTAPAADWFAFYEKNFNIFYQNKVPLHMFTHAAMFLRSTESFPGLIAFLEEIFNTHDDVWLVTPLQVIDWMQNPLTNQEMIDSGWGC